MLLTKPTVELVPQEAGLNGILKHIELVGRSCWMSQNMIKEGSATSFVESLKTKNHSAPFEHGTVYLYDTYDVSARDSWKKSLGYKYSNNKYSIVNTDDCMDIRGIYITTNYRVLFENNWLDDLKYMCEPTKDHELRLTFHFTCQRAISAEFNRHRHNSPMESSSRYCNFANDRFGREINVCYSDWLAEEAEREIQPRYFQRPKGLYAIDQLNKGLTQYCYEIENGYDIQNLNIVDYWWFANLACEYSYLQMIRLGAKPEQAREVLPLDLKTELYHTASVSDWLHFCELRAWKSNGNTPHPEAMVLAEPIFNTLKCLKLTDDSFRTEREL